MRLLKLGEDMTSCFVGGQLNETKLHEMTLTNDMYARKWTFRSFDLQIKAFIITFLVKNCFALICCCRGRLTCWVRCSRTTG